MPTPEGGFGIYLHWPYCEAKCPYCDFNSHVVRTIDHAAWTSAYLSELDRYVAEFPDRIVNSIYFGGGTPSLMTAETVGAVIDRITRRWPIANTLEITLEANPGSVEADRFRAYHTAGVNRVSLGVQALNDADLKALGRIHTVTDARRAIDIAKSTFDRASFDLIYARQNQTLAAWEAELKQALTLGFSHLSLYQLTIEDGTMFGERFRRGKLPGLPDEDASADMYEMTRAICAEAGMQRYEVSNFARPGEESRHNRIYWSCGDYVGIGPGAHGRLTTPDGTRLATETPRAPQTWLARAAEGNADTRTVLSPRDQAYEFLVMGLRVADGISISRFRELSGADLSKDAQKDLLALGAIEISGDRLKITQPYVGVLNTICEKLVPA